MDLVTILPTHFIPCVSVCAKIFKKFNKNLFTKLREREIARER